MGTVIDSKSFPVQLESQGHYKGLFSCMARPCEIVLEPRNMSKEILGVKRTFKDLWGFCILEKSTALTNFLLRVKTFWDSTASPS
jgi:hypothetical protein